MGVRGLQSFLESHCASACYTINMGKISEEYHKHTGKTPLIVVDGMSCLRKLYGKLNWVCGGQWKGYIDHIEEFVRSLQSHGIRLVFFFDGDTPERKRDTWIHRRLENLKDVVLFFNIIKMNKELEQGKHFFLPTALAAFTPLIYKDLLGCEVHTCIDECDKEVAEYAKKYGALGILGQDSDYTIYNTAPYYFSINHLNLETLDTIVYDRASLCRQLHITPDQLPLLSCLLGNDVIPQDMLQTFHKQAIREALHGHKQSARHQSRPPPEILIPQVACFINSQPPMDQLMTQLPQLARAVFHDDSKSHLLLEGIKMYQLDISAAEKYNEKYDDLEALPVMDRIRIRHLNSELGRHLFTILRGEPYESSTTLEDYTSNLPSGSIVFRSMRGKIYRILQKSLPEGEMKEVPEWCMYSGNAFKSPDFVDPEELPDGTPSLEDLWDGDEELRWRVFLDSIHPNLQDTNFRNLPNSLMVPVSLIFYIQCSQVKPVLKDWEMNAMLATFLSPHRLDLIKIRLLVLQRIDSRAVHCAAIFMKGLVNIYFLLSACNFPIDRKYAVPWEFWDGKVFHYYYLKAKSGGKIEDLCEHNEEILKQFMEIKLMITRYMPAPVCLSKSASTCSPEPSSVVTVTSPLERPSKRPDMAASSSSPARTSKSVPPNTLAIISNHPNHSASGKNHTGPPVGLSPASPMITKKTMQGQQKAKSPVVKAGTKSPGVNKSPVVAKSPCVSKAPAVSSGKVAS